MRRLGLAALIVFAVACDSELPAPPTSSRLPADAISLGVELRSNGGLAQIVVMLFHETGITSLSGEDALLFGVASDPSQRLTRFESERQHDIEDQDRNQSSYVGQLATDALDFELVLSRRGGARLVSTFTLPAPFALSVPVAPVSRAQIIPITWDADSETHQTQLELASPCLRQRIVRLFEFDPGAYEVQPADLFLDGGAMDCTLQAMVTRGGAAADFAPEFAPPPKPPRIEQVRVAGFVTVP
jgi:hypothetical protein